MSRWDPQQYEQFGDHRTRPFFDLLARVGATNPKLVVDLGCGNGAMTLALARRWPDATIVGVDNSSDMLSRARELDREERVRWEFADLEDWAIEAHGSPDVIVTNAALQWVPSHRRLIQRWLEALSDGGWFAMQVPGNFSAPSHQIIRDVAAAQPDAERLLEGYRMTSPVDDPADYLELLAAQCSEVDAWETTYVQLLDPVRAQQNPVLEWVKGTALRPLLDRLDRPGRDQFLADLDAALAQAYPRQTYGVPFPFRRIFTVAQK